MLYITTIGAIKTLFSCMVYEIEDNLIKNTIYLFILTNILLFHCLCITILIHTTHNLEKKEI